MSRLSKEQDPRGIYRTFKNSGSYFKKLDTRSFPLLTKGPVRNSCNGTFSTHCADICGCMYAHVTVNDALYLKFKGEDMRFLVLLSVFAGLNLSLAHAQDIDLDEKVTLKISPESNKASGKCEIIQSDGSREAVKIKPGMAEQSWPGKGAECVVKNKGGVAISVDLVHSIMSVERPGCVGSILQEQSDGEISMSGGTCPITVQPNQKASLAVNNA